IVTATAFFIDGGNRLLTDAHAVNGLHDLSIYVDGRPQPYKAEIERIDLKNDLASLKLIDVEKGRHFNSLKIADDSQEPIRGESVTEIGYPLGWSKAFISEGSWGKPRLVQDVLSSLIEGLLYGEDPF